MIVTRQEILFGTLKLRDMTIYFESIPFLLFSLSEIVNPKIIFAAM